MNSEEATKLAREFVRHQTGRELPLLGDARRNPGQHEWTLVFEHPTRPGAKTDGPIIVVVDEVSREARYF